MDDCGEFHRYVVSRKSHKEKDPTFKDRLLALEDQIQKQIKAYSDLLGANNLESIIPLGFIGQQKSDLLSLYRYKSKILQSLLISLTTKGERKFNTCQMCTVEPVGSFDHIVPKEGFPEYVVNPINLFPSCLTCNEIKGSTWVANGERVFLNLYYDILPNVPYLKIDFTSYPIPVYSIDGSSLAADFQSLVKSHYGRLGLFKRFRENSSEIIDPLISEAKKIVPIIGILEYRKAVSDSTTEMQSIYGFNHWKSLLKLSVVNHGEFESLLK
jgi:hypothetical protein